MIKIPTSLLGQLLAYAVGGGAVTVFHSACYWVMATILTVEPFLANSIAAILAGLVGFLLHSRWTFGGVERQLSDRAALTRYAVVSLICYGVNSFWVWLVIHRFGGTVNQSIIPMILATPWLGFLLNRFWAFR